MFVFIALCSHDLLYASVYNCTQSVLVLPDVSAEIDLTVSVVGGDNSYTLSSAADWTIATLCLLML